MLACFIWSQARTPNAIYLDDHSEDVAMNVKAQGLQNGAKYIEETFGREALGEVLRACSGGVRESYMTCLATSWHPVSELCEFVDVAQARLGGPRRSLAQEIGGAGARANMKGVLLRVALYWGKPEFLIKRIISTWRQYNDQGTMELAELTPGNAVLEVKGIVKPNATFCRILTGWWIEIAIGLGGRMVTATHSECRAAGGKKCTWELRGRVDELGLGKRL